jgi:hypothetical protein
MGQTEELMGTKGNQTDDNHCKLKTGHHRHVTCAVLEAIQPRQSPDSMRETTGKPISKQRPHQNTGTTHLNSTFLLGDGRFQLDHHLDVSTLQLPQSLVGDSDKVAGGCVLCVRGLVESSGPGAGESSTSLAVTTSPTPKTLRYHLAIMHKMEPNLTSMQTCKLTAPLSKARRLSWGL